MSTDKPEPERPLPSFKLNNRQEFVERFASHSNRMSQEFSQLNEQMDEHITETMFAQEVDNESLLLFTVSESTAAPAIEQPKQIKRLIKAETK